MSAIISSEIPRAHEHACSAFDDRGRTLPGGYTQHAPIAFWTLVFALLVTLGTAVFAGAPRRDSDDAAAGHRAPDMKVQAMAVTTAPDRSAVSLSSVHVAQID
jgi:hypothetical protein